MKPDLNETLRKLRRNSIEHYRGGDGWFMVGERENGYGLVPIIRSDYTNEGAVLNESNFETALKWLKATDDRTRTFWMSGFSVQGITYIEVPLTLAIAEVVQVSILDALADYPILDESDFSDREWHETERALEDCYDIPADRVGDVMSWLSDAGTYGDNVTSDLVAEACADLGIVETAD